jgi:hypothetical protein
MTKDNLWELLQAARKELAIAYADLDALKQTRRISTTLERIEDALVEHTMEKALVEYGKISEVEWTQHSADYFDTELDADTHVYIMRVGDRWGWTASVERKKSGYASTTEEAKDAAIKAARGIQ